MKPVRARMPRCNTIQGSRADVSPIEVCCRIRPLSANDVPCISGKDTTVVMTPPDSSLTSKGALKEVHYSFKRVFNSDTSQKTLFDSVAMPLIDDLLNGANGLLFTYGITSSGKTHTMSGCPQDLGILPRTLDVVFNSLEDCQVSKYIFKSDKLNGFEIQTSSEAVVDQQRDLANSSRSKRQKRKELVGEWNNRVCELARIEDINTDNNFAVFVSYVEIYNNYIYDLLEELPAESYVRSKMPQSKLLREDSTSTMYVFGVTEIEVKSADEALELFSRGQLRRRISHTALNAESSRSHSVFTIRVVQAPLNSLGSEILQDRNFLKVSQMSLVDLAGSERSGRTKNTGHKLREAGNINASLMTLRTCIEILRENQSQSLSKMVPYRESKLTHLFKTFFEGEGKIKMVVCVNPRSEDFDETTYVMRFAEMTQDVMITRTPVSTPLNLGMRAGRGDLFREAVRRAKAERAISDTESEPVIYSLGPDFPEMVMDNPDDETVLQTLIDFLEARIIRKEALNQQVKKKESEYRQNLMNIEKEIISLKQENIILQMDLKAREQQVKELERKVSSYDESVHVLKQKLASSERSGVDLKSQINDRENRLLDYEREFENVKGQVRNRIHQAEDRMKKMMKKKLEEKQVQMERELCFDQQKFRQLREILNFGEWELGGEFAAPPLTTLPETIPKELRMTRSRTVMPSSARLQVNARVQHQTKAISDSSVDQATSVAPAAAAFVHNIAVANPRHRRSQSSSGDVWLEHKPLGCLEFGTVLQPKMKKKKSVSKLQVKDVIQTDVSKYVLTHQEQDSKGEVETQLYKGDVIPSAGGGAQVIFNDVEKLTQKSPPRGAHNLRKRSAENIPVGQVENRCAVGLEGHGVPTKQKRAK